MNDNVKSLFFAMFFACASATGAAAQAQNNFARDRDLGVQDRPRPEYDAIGIPVSSFLLFPTLNLLTGYNDNIYATDTNVQADEYAQIQPSLLLKSQWSEHELDLNLHSSINQYLDHGSESTNDYGASVNGRLDVLASTNITGSASYDVETEARDDENAQRLTNNPIQFGLWTAQVNGMRQFNRLQISVNGAWDSYNFFDGRDDHGNIVDQHFRNVDDTVETIRADYALSPDTAVFLSGNINQHAYSVQPPLVPSDFNSNGFQALGGVNFQITSLLTGELGVGYMEQHYNHILGQNYGSLALHGTVQWFPTELTTVTAKVDRLVQNTAVLTSAGYVTTGGSIQADQELRYNLILTGLFSYNDDTFQGIDRDDQRWSAGIGVKYLFTRELGVGLNFNHDSQVSLGTDRFINFDINRVMINLVAQE